MAIATCRHPNVIAANKSGVLNRRNNIIPAPHSNNNAPVLQSMPKAHLLPGKPRSSTRCWALHCPNAARRNGWELSMEVFILQRLLAIIEGALLCAAGFKTRRVAAAPLNAQIMESMAPFSFPEISRGALVSLLNLDFNGT
jgi:hypothetical protein